MKAINVTGNKAIVEMSIDDLYTIFHALDAVVIQYDNLDKELVNRAKESVIDVHAELSAMIIKITDDKGDLISSN